LNFLVDIFRLNRHSSTTSSRQHGSSAENKPGSETLFKSSNNPSNGLRGQIGDATPKRTGKHSV